MIDSNRCQACKATREDFEGARDPVPLLSNDPPNVPISRLVHRLTGVSPRLARKRNCPRIERARFTKSCFA